MLPNESGMFENSHLRSDFLNHFLLPFWELPSEAILFFTVNLIHGKYSLMIDVTFGTSQSEYKIILKSKDEYLFVSELIVCTSLCSLYFASEGNTKAKVLKMF